MVAVSLLSQAASPVEFRHPATCPIAPLPFVTPSRRLRRGVSEGPRNPWRFHGKPSDGLQFLLRRLRRARARTMAGRDAAAFIRRRRLIMSLPSPRPGTERTCHPAPRDSRTRTQSTFPTFPASGPRRTAAPSPNHCPRRTHHLSAPWLHARHLAVPAHLPSSALSSRHPLTFAQTSRTIRSILDFPSSLGRFETVTSFRSVTVARADTAKRLRP